MNFGMRGEENFRSALNHPRCNAAREPHAKLRRFADNEMSCCLLGAEEIAVAKFLQQTASSANLAQHRRFQSQTLGASTIVRGSIIRQILRCRRSLDKRWRASASAQAAGRPRLKQSETVGRRRSLAGEAGFPATLRAMRPAAARGRLGNAGGGRCAVKQCQPFDDHEGGATRSAVSRRR